MKAIVAAGGRGTRLRPLTFTSNKHLIPVANKPLLLYPIEAIAETGIKEVGVIVNETRLAVEGLLGKGKKWGLTISYIDQPEALGLAHVVKISEEFLAGQPFLYHLGDNIFTEGIMRPFNRFAKEKSDALLTLVEHPENWRLGVPYFDKRGNLIKVVEKPKNPPNNYGVPGLYFFNHHVFKAFKSKDKVKPSARGELEITDLYTWLLNHHYKVIAEEVDGIWMDPGKFVDMLEANKIMLDRLDERDIKGQLDSKTTATGIVIIGKNSKITNSKIIGPVSIAAHTTIKNCRLGPHVSIASSCQLESIELKNSILMEETSLKNIQHTIIDSLIGKNTNVWEENKNSVSLFIGDHCNVRLT